MPAVYLNLYWAIKQKYFYVLGISRVHQKLLKYFNGTIISIFFVLPSAGVFPVIFALGLNDFESAKLSFGSSLLYYHKLPDVSE